MRKTLIGLVAAAGLLGGAAGGAGAIVNGTESAPEARPYQVSLQSGGEHYCGGTIVDATTIITAAHCLEGETAAGTTIRAGVTDLDSGGGQTVQVASMTSHPSYATNGLADIAVLKLATPLQLGSDVTAIPLATAAEVAGATTGTVSGWGAVSENGDGSSTLLEAQVPLVSDASCATSLGTDGPTELCAGGTGTDSCYGDSGGPLVVNSDRGPVLAGVTSWGEECGGATPGVYADVPGLTDWIEDNRGEAQAGDADEPGDEPTEAPADEDPEFEGELDDELDEPTFDDEGDFGDEDDWYFEDEGDFGDDEFFEDEDDFDWGVFFDDEYDDEGDFDDEYGDEDDWYFEDEGDFGDDELFEDEDDFDWGVFFDDEYGDEDFGDDEWYLDGEYGDEDDWYWDDEGDFGDGEYDDWYWDDEGDFDDEDDWFDWADDEVYDDLDW